ncbi:MAG TPA: alpha/beta fold hydrolase [Polyangiaceae bacterium]
MKLRLAKGASSTLILAHGAGAGSSHPWMVRYAEGLVARGIHVVTFDFPYVMAGKKAPDPAPRLEAAYRAVVADVRADEKLAGCKLFLGGKSMGGRMASHLAAKGEACDGLVFFGYPLHPPAKPAQRRDAHLPKITAPMLFVQGARDAFGTEDELVPLVASLGKLATLVVVPWGDHSLAVPKKSGKTQDEVDAGVLDAAAGWIRAR